MQSEKNFLVVPGELPSFFNKAQLALLMIAALTGPAAAQDGPTKAQSSAKFTMPLDSWASLGIAAEAPNGPSGRIDLKARPDDTEDVIVYGHRVKRVDIPDAPGTDFGRLADIPAAQPLVPYLGEGCMKGMVCTDPSQKGLFSLLPGN